MRSLADEDRCPELVPSEVCSNQGSCLICIWMHPCLLQFLSFKTWEYLLGSFVLLEHSWSVIREQFNVLFPSLFLMGNCQCQSKIQLLPQKRLFLLLKVRGFAMTFGKRFPNCLLSWPCKLFDESQSRILLKKIVSSPSPAC